MHDRMRRFVENDPEVLSLLACVDNLAASEVLLKVSSSSGARGVLAVYIGVIGGSTFRDCLMEKVLADEMDCAGDFCYLRHG